MADRESREENQETPQEGENEQFAGFNRTFIVQLDDFVDGNQSGNNAGTDRDNGAEQPPDEAGRWYTYLRTQSDFSRTSRPSSAPIPDPVIFVHGCIEGTQWRWK